MDFKYIILLAGFSFTLLTSFAATAWLSRSFHFSEPRKAIVAAIFTIVLSALPLIPLAFFPSIFEDFIRHTIALSFLLPLLGIFAVAVVYFLVENFRWRLLATTLAITLPVVFLPDFYVIFYEGMPTFLNQLGTIILWLAATYSLRLLSGINGLGALEITAISFGIIIIALIGGAPLLLGVAAACLTAAGLALVIYSRYPAKIALTPPTFDLVGLFLGWILVITTTEGSGASAYILCLYLIIETLWSLLQRITFLPQYQDIYANTVYYQANIFGLNPILINNHITRVNIVLIMFGCFQVFAPNNYSLPMICTIIVMWNMYRLYNWQNQPKNLKEINREFAKEFKQGLKDVKKNFNREE